jgi:hypothetical protein
VRTWHTVPTYARAIGAGSKERRQPCVRDVLHVRLTEDQSLHTLRVNIETDDPVPDFGGSHRERESDVPLAYYDDSELLEIGILDHAVHLVGMR